MPKKEKLPRLTEQTFHEAGGRELFGKLTMLGLVQVEKVHIRDKHSLDRLITRAKHNYGKVDYIFDVKYGGEKENVLSGTAYKIKGPIRRYFSGFTWKL